MVNIIGRKIDLQPVGTPASESGLGALMANLGKQLFGDQLTPELKRRQAEHIDLQNVELARKNLNVPVLAANASNPDASIADIVSSAILSGNTGQLGDLLRVRAANTYGAEDPRTTNAYVGAGGAYGSTVAGTREGEATKIKMADMTSQRQADGQVRAAGLAPVEAVDPSGAPAWTTRADIANGGAAGRGLSPILSSDQVVGSELRPALTGQPTAPASGQPPAPASGQPPAPAGGPPLDPFDKVPPSIRKKAGMLIEPKPYINPKTNTVAVSFDGGGWGVTDEGEWMPLRSGAWVPAGPETAVTESRLALMKAHAARGNPNLTERDPLTGEVAKSAYKATGVDAFGQEHANALLGSLGVTRLFGAGEVGPDYERARSNLEVFRQTAKAAFNNSPTFPIKEQAMIDRMLPSAALFANPESEARKVGTLYTYLKADNERLRQVIESSADPATANRANQALTENEKTLEMLTRGAAGASPKAPSRSPGRPPAPAAPAAGVTHVWTPDGGLREAGR